MRNPLLRRLEKVERQQTGRAGASGHPWTRVITENDEDLRQQLADLKQAGRYTPGWPVIDRRIIDSSSRSLPYATSLSDAEWAVLAPLLPAPSSTGRPWRRPLRAVFDGTRHVLAS